MQAVAELPQDIMSYIQNAENDPRNLPPQIITIINNSESAVDLSSWKQQLMDMPIVGGSVREVIAKHANNESGFMIDVVAPVALGISWGAAAGGAGSLLGFFPAKVAKAQIGGAIGGGTLGMLWGANNVRKSFNRARSGLGELANALELDIKAKKILLLVNALTTRTAYLTRIERAESSGLRRRAKI